MMNEGMVYVFTGDGKGKTSAALGVSVRAVASGMRVGWVAWYKQESWRLSESKLPGMLGEDNFEMYFLGEGFHLKSQISNFKTQDDNSKIKTAEVGRQGQLVVDKVSEEEHVRAAKNALEKAESMLDRVDVLVLDEVNNAVDDGLVKVENLFNLISGRGKTHVVLTGRNADQKIIDIADLATEMKKVKHPYDKGKLAVKGLDY